MRKFTLLTAIAAVGLATPALSVQPADPDMETDTSDQMDGTPMQNQDATEGTVEQLPPPIAADPTENAAPIPPTAPATETPKVMDAARPDQPASASTTAEVTSATAEYPVCSKTVTDRCINPRAARGNPR